MSSALTRSSSSFDVSDIEDIATVYAFDEDEDNPQAKFTKKKFEELDGESENNGFFDEDEENDADNELKNGLTNGHTNVTNGKKTKPRNKYIIDESIDYNEGSLVLPYNQVIGLNSCKQLLVDIIGKPYLYPELYYGFTKVSKFAYMCGGQGMGKYTLIKSFCKRYGLHLIVIDGTIQVENMMQRALNYATNHPSVIYFDQCDHFFKEGGGSQIGKEFLYYYHKYEIAKYNIWSVFGFTSLVTEVLPALRGHIGKNARHAVAPNPKQRKVLIKRFLGSKYISIGHRNFSEKEYEKLIDEIVAASTNLSAGVIKSYLGAVFTHRLNTLGIKRLRKLKPDSEDVLPIHSDFKAKMIYNGAWSISELTHRYTMSENAYVNWRRTSNPNIKRTMDQKKKQVKRTYSNIGAPALDASIFAPSKVRKKNTNSPLRTSSSLSKMPKKVNVFDK